MKKFLKGCFGCFGIIIVAVLLLFLGTYVYYNWFWEEWPVERIERVTGIRVPKYRVIKLEEGERHFTGDYEDRYEIEFKTAPSDELFAEIDKMIANSNTGWQRDGNRYFFSVIWGNGLPTPKGESDEADGTFSLTITKGEKVGEIRSGSW